MPFRVTKSERTIIVAILMLIVLGLIGMAVL